MLPQSTEQGSMSYTLGSYLLSVLHIVSIAYICQSSFPNSSHPTFPDLCPYVCSLYLCLYLCLQIRTSISFLQILYICINIHMCFSLSDLLYSVWHSLGPSMSLQMTQFCSLLQLSDSPLNICITSSLSFPLLMDNQVSSMS